MTSVWLPQTVVSGRITNALRLKRTKSGALYLQLLIYLCHGHQARLMPMLALRDMARDMYKRTQQGDLLQLTAQIVPINNHRYLNPTLIVSGFSFLESKTIRDIYHGKRGRQLHVLFPVYPENCVQTKSVSSHEVTPKRHSHKRPKRHIKVVTGEIERPKSDTAANDYDAQTHQEPQTAEASADGDSNWIDKAVHLSRFKFPGFD